MSFDVFVQGIRDTDVVPLPSAVFHAVFGPFVDERVPEQEFWHITMPDGGAADIYAETDGDTFTGFMINHFSPGQVLDLLADFAARADAVIMPVGCPVLVPTERLSGELPVELRTVPPVVVESGADIETALREAVRGPGPKS